MGRVRISVSVSRDDDLVVTGEVSADLTPGSVRVRLTVRVRVRFRVGFRISVWG